MCELFELESFVCPPLLQSNVFSTYDVDNIDHNLSSRAASDSWHGTAILATQHLEHANEGVYRPPLQLSETKTNSFRQLPVTYTTINLHVLKSEDVLVPPRLIPSQDKVDVVFKILIPNCCCC